MSLVAAPPVEPKPAAPLQKRGRGRPPKYATEEERIIARRAQILRSVKQHRARIRAEPSASASVSAGANNTKTVRNKDATVQDASPTEESIVRSQTPGKQVTSPKHASAFEYFNRMPPELALMQASSLIDGLHGVWMDCTKGDESWWPSVPKMQLTNGGPTRQLVASARIAAFASNVGVSRADEGLIRLGSIAYHQTLHDMRQLMAPPYLQMPNYSIALVMVAYSLISYEFSTCLQSAESLPKSPMWAVHGEASNHIARQAGPDAFRSPLGRRVLVGLLPQTCMAKMGMRQHVNWANPEWLDLLEGTVWPTYRDGIWPIAIHIPGYMQRLDIYDVDLAVAPDDVSLTNVLLNLSDEVRMLDSKLDMWLEAFRAQQGALEDVKLYWGSTSLPEGPIWNIFSPHIQFATISTAEIMMLYWTFKLNLSQLISGIDKRLATSPLLQQQQLPTPSYNTDKPPLPPQHYAYLICRAAHYWLTQSDPSPSTNTIYNCFSFPLRVAWRVWAKSGRTCEAEYHCTAQISNHMRTSSYAGKMGEYVITFAYAPPPKLFVGEEEVLKAEREVSKDPREPVSMMQRIVKATYNLW